MTTATEVIEAGTKAASAGRRAGAIVLLSLALVATLALLGYERFHSESDRNKLLDRWTGSDQKGYADDVNRRFTATQAELNALQQSAAGVRATLDAMKAEQQRQGAQLDRVLERLSAGPR